MIITVVIGVIAIVIMTVMIVIRATFPPGENRGPPVRPISLLTHMIIAPLGWHYLSKATCLMLMRPHLFSTASLV